MKTSVLVPFQLMVGVFFNLPAFPNETCDLYSKCKTIKTESICFKADNISKGVIWQLSNSAVCGHFNEQYIVSNATEFREVFRKYASECTKIKRLNLFGHGNSGRIFLNDKPLVGDLGVKDYFSGLDCAFIKNAEIEIFACNAAAGCAGARFMHAIAATALKKGGRVVASRFLESSFAPGIVPHFSLTNQYRTVSYLPEGKPAAYFFNSRGPETELDQIRYAEKHFPSNFEKLKYDPIQSECFPDEYLKTKNELASAKRFRDLEGLFIECSDSKFLKVYEDNFETGLRVLKDHRSSQMEKFQTMEDMDNDNEWLKLETIEINECVSRQVSRRDFKRINGKYPEQIFDGLKPNVKKAK